VRRLKVLIIGGTGIISRACVREAVEQGHEVHVLHRGSTSSRGHEADAVRHIADIRDADAVAEAIAGIRFDVVAQFLAFTEEHVARDLLTFRDAGQYIFVSSASAYQTPPSALPVTESTPLRNPFWQYSRDKIAAEDRLVRAYRESGFPVTIVRPSHTYDATMLPFDAGWTVVDRMRRGAEVVVHGDGTSLWTITHSTDFARGFVGLFGRAQAIGEAFHITGDEAPTWNRIYEEIARAAGVVPRLVHIASETIAAADPDWGAALLGDKANSMTFDNSKLRRLVPDFRAEIPFAQGAEQIIDWHDAHPESRVVDPRWDRLMDVLVDRNTRVTGPIAPEGTTP